MARSDMFLKATGQRSGEILGESSDKAFANQVDVVDWSWGMTAPSAVSGQRSGRVALGELKVVKRVDKASTAFMAVMATNEVMPKVVLTVRKAGGTSPLPYFIITLTQARIDAYSVHSEIGDEGSPILSEHLSFTFRDITCDYTPQSSTGQGTGTSSFTGHAGGA